MTQEYGTPPATEYSQQPASDGWDFEILENIIFLHLWVQPASKWRVRFWNLGKCNFFGISKKILVDRFGSKSNCGFQLVVCDLVERSFWIIMRTLDVNEV